MLPRALQAVPVPVLQAQLVLLLQALQPGVSARSCRSSAAGAQLPVRQLPVRQPPVRHVVLVQPHPFEVVQPFNKLCVVAFAFLTEFLDLSHHGSDGINCCEQCTCNISVNQ